jgi:hypothetical protein
MSAGNFQGGKKVWFTTTTASYTNQELVTYGAYYGGFSGDGSGVPNYHMVYQGFNFAPLNDVAVESDGTKVQLGSEIPGVCDPYEASQQGNPTLVNGCWDYATDGTWDTLLYHVVPGRNGVAETVFEVWAAHSGETSYTKIWSVTYPANYDTGTGSLGQPNRPGWNALILSAYSNGFQGIPLTAFTESYDQVIFSKEFIPAPSV